MIPTGLRLINILVLLSIQIASKEGYMTKLGQHRKVSIYGYLWIFFGARRKTMASQKQ